MTNRLMFAHMLALLCILTLMANICPPPASADDAELLRSLPGQWVCSDDVTDENDNEYKTDLVLTFEENGNMTLRVDSAYQDKAYSLHGTWSFELVPNAMDRMTLRFAPADHSSQTAGTEPLECVYNVYAESWVEQDVEHTYMILESVHTSGISPFEDVYGYGDSIAFHREEGPNMRIVNCKSYVSLREKRSKSSARLARVPLGALVLAYPEYGDENGFILCVYQDEYGYILSEYLEPVGQ